MKHPRSPSSTYVAFVVGALALVQTSSFADRMVITVLQPPIKREFALSDLQVGLLGGLAFSAVYAVLGLPIARAADRRSRRLIVTGSLLAWSAATTLCGLATSYAMLFALRFGVGIGEAGSTPASHSMIADYVTPARRGAAMSVLSTGVPLGALLGSVIGGVVAQHHGWRAAFVVIGLPGFLLATLVMLAVREPPRRAAASADSATVCVRLLLRHRFYRHLVLAQVMMAVAGYGIGAFAALYLVRAFGLSLTTVGTVLGLGFGVLYAVGLAGGGLAHDRWGFGRLPALVTLAAAPVTIAAFVAPAAGLAVTLLIASTPLQAFAVAPTYAAIHNRVPGGMRATAIATLLLMTNLVGAGLGPALVGLVSDGLAGFAFRHGMFAASCPGGEAAAQAHMVVEDACREASVFGLRWAVVLVALAFVASAVHYALAARCMDREAAAPGPAAASEAAPA